MGTVLLPLNALYRGASGFEFQSPSRSEPFYPGVQADWRSGSARPTLQMATQTSNSVAPVKINGGVWSSIAMCAGCVRETGTHPRASTVAKRTGRLNPDQPSSF
jgi:hypothetical protein